MDVGDGDDGRGESNMAGATTLGVGADHPRQPAAAGRSDGRFGYDRLPLYRTEPEKRFPFLIRRDGRTVGFALAMRGPASDDPDDLDLQEFFVLRRYRRVGREAACSGPVCPVGGSYERPSRPRRACRPARRILRQR